jgi:hypothetical protein
MKASFFQKGIIGYQNNDWVIIMAYPLKEKKQIILFIPIWFFQLVTHIVTMVPILQPRAGTNAIIWNALVASIQTI